MKSKEDIGSLIKSKLQSAERASNEPTWERIQHSLEERKRKRMFAFYAKLGTVGLLLLIGSLLTVNYMSTKTENALVSKREIYDEIDCQETNSVGENKTYQAKTDISRPILIVSESNEVKKAVVDNSISQEVIKIDTTISISKNIDLEISNDVKGEKETAGINVKNEITKPKTTALKEIKKTTDLDTIVNRNDVPVTHTSKRVYYYYNSKNGEEISSTDKGIIDSIMLANQIKKDSLK